MSYTMEMGESHAAPIAAIREVIEFGKLAETIIRLLDRVYEYLPGATVRQDGHNVVVYLDQKPTIEVGVEVSGDFDGTGDVISSHLPAGRIVRTVHLGPYNGLPGAHGAVRAWCEKQRLELAGPNWEIYGDWNDDPTKLETEVCYLVKGSN